jgi:hypothetical protein
MVWPDEDYCIRLDINIKTQGPMLKFVYKAILAEPLVRFCKYSDTGILVFFILSC